ncbi:MAG: hypothetical protein ABI791_15135, partial [Acidobacteriota bacterium]
MARRFWWPGTISAQVMLVENFAAKFGNYATTLGMLPADVTLATDLCETFVAACNGVDQSRATMMALTQWRDELFYGEPVGGVAPPAPGFPGVTVATPTLGTVTQFFALRDRIVTAPKYTTAIGEDLGIIGSEITPKPIAEVAPEIKTTVSAGYRVNIAGSLQGNDAMRIEYAPKGGTYS